ncbi:MAG TPA: M3 family metallopeptidase [Acidobacteriaceae bacterium]|nr:M3 family metallopeptidase [Acidobacteriaceae bacterium]
MGSENSTVSQTEPLPDAWASKWGDPLHIWVGGTDVTRVQGWADAHLAAADAEVQALVAVSGSRTVENTLRPFDEAQRELDLAGSGASLLTNASPQKALRDLGQQISQKVAARATELSLNVQVYQALAAIDASNSDAATRHYLENVLLQYRLSGIDKDDATRERVRALSDKLTMELLSFQRNIADSQGKILVKDETELEGLPADFIARHTAAACGGQITLTTDEPDYRPVMTYAKSESLRRRMYLAYSGRAYPANEVLLKQVLATRAEFARELGFTSWAELATVDKLVKAPANVRELLAELGKAAKPVAEREYAQILAFAQKHMPDLKTIPAYGAGYWMELYQREAYGFDSLAVRAYFQFAEVQRGVLETMERLFHVKLQEVKGLELWHDAVTVFDVEDATDASKTKKLGRIYLDMHPREGKNKWFNAGTIVTGIRNGQLPEARLNGNFVGGDARDPGLMLYSDVVTFFHEFGHLMHAILGSHQDWVGTSAFNVEWDFVEVPSQMLEEFLRDKKIVDSFAKHYETGELMPDDLFRKMLRADAFGRGLGYERQIALANYSLELHDRPVDEIDVDAMWKKAAKDGGPWEWVDGNKGFATFGHLMGYSSNYYTYSLSKVIALDFFNEFRGESLLDGPVGMRYRRIVMEPGGSVSAKELVNNFLGRSQSYEAFREWMKEGIEN